MRFDTLAQQRDFANRILLALLWIFVPLVAMSALAFGADPAMYAGAGAVFAGAAHLMARVSGGSGSDRMTIGVALMCQVSLLVASASNGPWQADMHMAYFAALAMLAAYCDWRVILAGAAVVAVHHLSLNFLLPAAVFPGGGDLARVVLHAVILIAEAVTLMWLCHSIVHMFASVAAKAEEARVAGDMAAQAKEAEMRGAEAQARMRAEVAAQQALVVERLARGLEQLADGNLTVRLTDEFSPEYRALKENFNISVERLEGVVSQIVKASQSIRGSAGEVSNSADDLSQRTERQAATLEETAAALDEITRAVSRTAEMAQKTQKTVGEVHGGAANSLSIIERTVSAMGNIEASSGQIGQIISIIDEIAFQTNLLALNAGVEAARAGEAGRGFAVVAQEVRALAQRSAEAARQIKGLISTSETHVKSGVALVGETGGAVSLIASKVVEILDAMREIASLTSAQSSGLQELNTAMVQMDRATQMNAAMVEESTAASHMLNDEASTLASAIARFKVGQAPAGRGYSQAA
jgi:methyl-accepting chemotaxis protein